MAVTMAEVLQSGFYRLLQLAKDQESTLFDCSLPPPSLSNDPPPPPSAAPHALASRVGGEEGGRALSANRPLVAAGSIDASVGGGGPLAWRLQEVALLALAARPVADGSEGKPGDWVELQLLATRLFDFTRHLPPSGRARQALR
jgi:hypothetical protein